MTTTLAVDRPSAAIVPSSMPVAPVASRRMRLGRIAYRDRSHAGLPHIVSFSGGRSSAALAFAAARDGLLKAERGDLLVFANTSAEHPGTYEFAAECKRRIEDEFGLPFLWFEFCTVEDAHRGQYHRRQSYRLVKPVPVEDDPDGYRSRGEVFEEMLDYQGMLPTPHQRTCTAKLKLYPSHKLLADWLGGMPGPTHAGHHWADSDGRWMVLADPESCADRYKANRGSASRESVLGRFRRLGERPSARPAQRFADFTAAAIPDRRTSGRQGDPRPAPMRGRQAAEHVRLLGLRADEPRRVMRVMDRCLYAEGASTSACTVHTQPPGERPYFPLHEHGMDEQAVHEFWQAQDFDLDIPDGAGNCTFCFMKGTRNLVRLSKRPDSRREQGTPSHIGWWEAVEGRHTRTVPRRNGNGTSTFGFFGVNTVTFAGLTAGTVSRSGRYSNGTPACDCTD